MLILNNHWGIRISRICHIENEEISLSGLSGLNGFVPVDEVYKNSFFEIPRKLMIEIEFRRTTFLKSRL